MCCILNKRCETGKQNHREQDLGLSPNGKATDSDSVIFQVRILVALLQTPKENSSGVFVITAQKGCRVAEPSDSCYNNCKREHSQYRRKDGYVYIDGERLLSDIYGNELIKDPQTAADPITLKENEYFVMGDNRNHSMDSRDPSVGVLTKEDLIGRAWVRIYPFDNIGVIRHE